MGYKKLFSISNAKKTLADSLDFTGGRGGYRSGGLRCPKCGDLIQGDIPEYGIYLCGKCTSVLKIRNHQIDK